jgi:hypothetical protein
MLPVINHGQNVLLQADFNGCALPPGWTVNLIGAGAPAWEITNTPFNPNAGTSTFDGSCMVIVDDELVGADSPSLTTQFVTPPFNATGYSTIKLQFDVHFSAAGQSAFSVYAFDGNQYALIKRFRNPAAQTGNVLADYRTYTTDLSFYANPAMRLLFEFDDAGGQAKFAGFDNLLVTGEGDATNLVLEDFNDCNLPNGWDREIASGTRSWNFGFQNTPDTQQLSMNGTCMAYFNDRGIGDSLQNAPPATVILFSPWLNGAAFSQFFLDFDAVFHKTWLPERFEAGVWDGVNFQVIKTFNEPAGSADFEYFTHHSLDLSLYRAPTFRVFFRYDDGGGWGGWVGIDNVKITASQPANDLCQSAFSLFTDQPCLSGNNLAAMPAFQQPGCVPPFHSAGGAQSVVNAVWYHYQPTSGGLVKLSTLADFNDVVSVFEGACDNLTAEICTNRDEFGFTGESLFFNAIPGRNYYIRIGGLRGAFGQERGNYCIDLQIVSNITPAPSNDFCASAKTITLNEPCTPGANLDASFSGPVPPGSETASADIWYRFIATTPDVDIETQTDFAEVIALYQGDCGNLLEIATNPYGKLLTARDLTLGNIYYIQVSGAFATVEGNLCIRLKPHDDTPPPNDLCALAAPISIGSACVPLSTLDALLDGPPPSCIFQPKSNVWFKFVAPPSGSVKINTDADFPAVMAIYGGECDSPVEIACFEHPLRCEGFTEIADLTPGHTYLVQVATNADVLQYATSGNICVTILDGTANGGEPLSLDAFVQCTGAGVGIMKVLPSGGVGNYVIQGNKDGDVLYTGDSWLVIVTDEAGCQVSLSGRVNCGVFNCPLIAGIVTTPVTCGAPANGAATAWVQAAAGSVTYKWSNGSSQSFTTNLPPGNVSVTVTDASGCAVVATAVVSVTPDLSVQVVATHETAWNANDGTAMASAASGKPPYSFAWSNGSISPSQTGLPPGNYTVSVTDAAHCVKVKTVTVQPYVCSFSAAAIAQPVSCNSGSNGQATALPIGGLAPFTYNWSNNAVSQLATNLSPGLYAVTITDSKRCTAVATALVTEPQTLAANAVGSGETFNGANNGVASATPTGGVAPYSFAWSNGQPGASIDGLSPGAYTVTVTDARQCSAVETVSVAEFQCHLVATLVQSKHITCFGKADGSAEVTGWGGVPPYQYHWANGSDSTIATGLDAGLWTVTITDAALCETVLNVSVEEPSYLFTTLVSLSDARCEGDPSGSATVTASGGTAPYHFDWLDVGTGATQTSLANGLYTVWVTDANGCASGLNVIIEVADAEPPVLSAHSLTVLLDENGQATITLGDLDAGSYDNCGDFTLTAHPLTFDCNDLGKNIVALFAMDRNGNFNSATATVTVIDNSPPVLTCPGDIFTVECQNSVEYQMPIATDNCSLSPPMLTGGLPSGVLFPEGQTTVSYAIADAAGNTAFCAFTVTVSNALSGIVYIEIPSCSDASDGSAEILPQGGFGAHYFQWNDPLAQNTAKADSLATGIYTVTVTDEGGCSFEASALVPGPLPLSVGLESVTHESTPGSADGAVHVQVEGGSPPYAFEWLLNGVLVSTDEDPTGLIGGEYSLIVRDANGCIGFLAPVLVETTLAGAWERHGFPHWSLSPNPAGDRVFVTIEGAYLYDFQVVVYDPVGRKAREIAPDTSRQFEIDLQGLSPGVYAVKLLSGEYAAVKKLVIH